jgi:hypothetical protein
MHCVIVGKRVYNFVRTVTLAASNRLILLKKMVGVEGASGRFPSNSEPSLIITYLRARKFKACEA